MEHWIKVMATYFRQAGWTFDQVSESALGMSVEVSNGHLLCTAEASERSFIVYSLYPFTVPRSKRMLVAEFIVRANYRTELGALDLDLDDGEVGFKSGIAIEGSQLSPTLIASAMQLHLSTADRWFAGVAAVCFTDVTPRIALQHCIDRFSIPQVVEFGNDLLGSD